MEIFYDKYLDHKGEQELQKIIEISKDNRVKANQLIDRLIEKYPRSPQLQISKGIIMSAPKNILLKRERFERAIELDEGFYNGYRWLAKTIWAIAWRLNNATSLERIMLERTFAVLMAEALSTPDPHAHLLQSIVVHEEFYRKDWKELHYEAIKVLETGLKKIDYQRYPKEETEGYFNEFLMLKTMEDYMIKAMIFDFYMMLTG